MKRTPKQKTVKIGNQVFDLGRVYSNPYHRAFQPTEESDKKPKTDIDNTYNNKDNN